MVNELAVFSDIRRGAVKMNRRQADNLAWRLQASRQWKSGHDLVSGQVRIGELESGKCFIVLISDAFLGKGSAERQEFAWARINEIASPDEWQHIGRVVCYTHDENDDRWWHYESRVLRDKYL